ncbi:MAG: hypothetical protein ACI8PZ_001250 [Myxococcota bacterium]|jgi:hypothetical protein
MRLDAALIFAALALGCTATDGARPADSVTTTTLTTTTPASPRADVVAARASGDDGDLTVYVTVRSDETGCDQYTDWWEVVSPQGALIARRVLGHSHPDDNPFERSEAGVAVTRATDIVIRAHMSPGGYVGDALAGSFDGGFATAELPQRWADALQREEPLPDGCLF